jgi:signal transduction histidine kinase
VINVDQARRYGEIIDAQSRRLGHIVDQALVLTGATAKRVSSRCAVSVPAILSTAIGTFAARMSEAGIEVEQRIAPEVPDIRADPELV